MYWHAHEMLFGFVTAAISGFFLTAAPGWTGRAAGSAASTIPLALLWLAGRIAMAPFIAIPLRIASFVDLSFLPALVLTLALSLIRARKYQSLSLIWPLGAIFLANILFHLGMHGALAGGEYIGLTVSIDVVTILLVIIGGRLIPAFTRSGLNGRDIAAILQSTKWVDAAAIGSVVAVLVIDISEPLSNTSGAVALLGGLAQALRIIRWLGRSGARNPMISIFHIAYAWVIVGLLLKGVWLLTATSFADKWIHALTVGAFGTMILAVMARTSPGLIVHGPNVSRKMALSYGFITAAAAIRVFAPSLLPGAYNTIVALSGMCWIAAFGIFLGTCMLVTAGSRARMR